VTKPHSVRTADYDYELPERLIAQSPLDRRDDSRLLVVNRATGEILHRRFADLPELMSPGDALVVNATRVYRARLLGTRSSGSPAEVFLLRALGDNRFEALVKPGGKLHPGRVVTISPELTVEILEITDRRSRIVRLHTPLEVNEAIERFGDVPLPPYINRQPAPTDAERYQTVYARERGSVAAPTAGLHFTNSLLSSLEARGVRRCEVILHVGAGTFKPVESEDLRDHVMHEESYTIDDNAAALIEGTRAAGGSVWAVGTTSLRALESAVREDGTLKRGTGETRLFIHPPYQFRAVDKLITNFHLPRSTLLMLVSAFAGHELTMRAYREAIDAEYRFFSFGDAMAVL
jgi:S-adenosylmethionine:tRNA ribosyltransferase-isomerase